MVLPRRFWSRLMLNIEVMSIRILGIWVHLFRLAVFLFMLIIQILSISLSVLDGIHLVAIDDLHLLIVVIFNLLRRFIHGTAIAFMSRNYYLHVNALLKLGMLLVFFVFVFLWILLFLREGLLIRFWSLEAGSVAILYLNLVFCWGGVLRLFFNCLNYLIDLRRLLQKLWLLFLRWFFGSMVLLFLWLCLLLTGSLLNLYSLLLCVVLLRVM